MVLESPEDHVINCILPLSLGSYSFETNIQVLTSSSIGLMSFQASELLRSLYASMNGSSSSIEARVNTFVTNHNKDDLCLIYNAYVIMGQEMHLSYLDIYITWKTLQVWYSDYQTAILSVFDFLTLICIKSYENKNKYFKIDQKMYIYYF